jgi:formylglycine-generating enzyme required for sulfatase activity
MGHWERDYVAEAEAGDGKYVYTSDPPTLLAAGLRDQTVTGSGKVTVTMWPLVVDTVFSSGERDTAPVVTAGKPAAVSLLPVNWDVKWTITRGTGGNGLLDLVKAQKIPVPAAGEDLLLKSAKTLVRPGDGKWDDVTPGGNVITRSIGTRTSGFGKIGTSGSVNFKLEYIPFNLTGNGGTNPWTRYHGESAFELDGEKEPVWIIRNGVNDRAQDTETDFTGGWAGVANGNGAIAFKVEVESPEDPDNPQTGDMVVKDGVFVGPSDSETPDIKFTTAGYSGNAEVYYAVVGGGVTKPGYSAYTGSLGVLGTGEHTEEVTLTTANGDYDIYVIAYKDGKVSAPVVINTASAGEDVDWEWGKEAFVYVEGGTFQMGMAGELWAPVHEVTVSGFYMGRYEVTQAEWVAVMGTNPSYFQGAELSDYQRILSAEERVRLPVEYVTWNEVVDFCNALSELEGLDPAYTIDGTSVTWNSGADGYRLPTEAEWEYAARGGKNQDGYEYSGSDTVDDVAWYYDNSYEEKTRPVGGKAANSLGLHDMSGNVYEWCWDWFGGYSSEAQTDPTGASSGTNRVNRGGSWFNSAAVVRSERYANIPSYRAYNLGFRLVRPLD